METLIGHILLPIVTCYLASSSISRFVYIISCQNVRPVPQQSHQHEQQDQDHPLLYPALVDLSLVLLFIVQHKLMSTVRFKRFMAALGVTVVERLFHVAVTSLTLLTVMSLWEPISGWYLWYIDTQERFFLWLFFVLLHVTAWLLMLIDALTMEPLEMIGLKQIYNHHMDLGPPMQYLPKMLQQCFRRIRHPGPVLLVLVMWVHPQMTFDRLIISYLFTWFMWCAFKMSGGQYRGISKWICETREEIVFEERYRVPGRRNHNIDSGCEMEFSD